MVALEIFLSLDLTSLDEALRIADLSIEAGFKHLEAGTPLIKSEGMRAVRSLRARFPDVKIFADTKTMDTGHLEADLAFSAGADLMSVMAVAPDETIKEAVRKAEESGGEILVDTLGLKEIIPRLKEIIRFGIHRICLHRGVDEGVFSDYELLDYTKELGVKMGVAGGIDESTIGEVARKADFVMIGRAITKSSDPKTAAIRILRKVNSL